MKRLLRVWNNQVGKASLASLLIVSIAMLSFGIAVSVPRITKAAALTSVSDTLSTSAPATAANHTILFVTPSGVTNTGGEEITITFASGFDTDSIKVEDVDLAEDDDAACDGTFTDKDLAEAVGSDQWGFATSSNAITFTGPNAGSTGGITAGRCVQIEIGTNATASTTGTNQITNPSKTAAVGTADISSIDFTGSFNDTGSALVATIEAVTVSVTIDENLAFSLGAESAANCPATIPGTDQSDDASHDSSTISFGTLTAGDAFNHSCHLATVTTNASSGYATTIEKSALLTSGVNTIADGSCDTGCTVSSSTGWATTTNNGFGYCLEDVTGDPAATADATSWASANQCDDSSPEFKLFPTTATTEDIMSSAAPVSADQIRMGVVLNYTGTQAAGTYTTTLTFIATPTF